MQVAKPDNLVRKANKKISNVAKNTSCSRGWLRGVVQCMFCAITIVSFIMILYTTIANTVRPERELRCSIDRCSIICHSAPEFKNYANDIVSRVAEASISCKQVMLTLNNPTFENSTMPVQWLSNLRSNVYELNIVGGNLNYINPQAFLTPFGGNLQRLILKRITLIRWVPQTLIGLSNLEELILINCNIILVENNALDAVDETLTLFSITGSGFFDPRNLTGSGSIELITKQVVFTDNNLNTILDRNSFTNLKKCKDLYLNSNRIVALGSGTFDNLHKIQSLYLNDNLLVALPTGIFDTIIAITNPRPRISLQTNMWHCDCNNDIRHWVEQGILMLDTTCRFPYEVRGQSFTEFVKTCNSNILVRQGIRENSQALSFYYTDTVNSNGTCDRALNEIQPPKYYQSPLDFLSCPVSNNQTIFNLIKTSIRELISKAENEFIRGRFALRADSFSMMEVSTVGSSVASNYGLVWFQSECPDEIHCINTMPSILRVYNINDDVQYTFCPIYLSTGELKKDKCIIYNVPTMKATLMLRILSYLTTVVFCFTLGACIVYAIIRKFPNLLKGSDRILFVKHKNVDALVLPPKVPVRSVNSADVAEVNKEIFVLSDNMINRSSFVRMQSSRSAKSTAPSYVSALQPTDEQLSEWRLRHHFNNDLTVTSGMNIPYLLLPDEESLYCSIGEVSNSTYQSCN